MRLEMISELMNFEEQLLERYQQGSYTDGSFFRKDIVKLLSGLASCHNEIKTDVQLKWVCDAIVRWKHFLSSRFDILSKTALPTVGTIPAFQQGRGESPSQRALQKRASSHTCDAEGLSLTERVRQAEDIFEGYGDVIRAMIALNVKDQSMADDVFQDLFLSVVNTPLPPEIDRLETYLYRVITNDVIDETRRLNNYAEFVRGYRECANYKTAQVAHGNDAIELEEACRLLQMSADRLAS